MVMSQASDNATSVSLPARFLGTLAATAAARPRLTLWLVLLLACGSVGITFNDMKLRTSRGDLVDPTAAFSRTWHEYKTAFGVTSDLVVVVETEDANPALIRTVLDDLGERLEREPELFAHPLYRIQQRAMRKKALQLLSPSELKTTMRRVDAFDPVVRNRQWDLIRTEALAARLRRQIVAAERAGEPAEHLYKYANLLAESLSHFMLVSSSGASLENATFQSPWPELVSVGADDNVTDTDVAYFLNAEANVGLLQVFPVDQPTQLAANEESILRLRELISEVTAIHQPVASDLKVLLTGIPVLEHDEISQSTDDMTNAAAIALVAVTVLLIFGFRGVRHPMLALLTLVIAVCWTAGAATLVIGHLNIISVCFVVILIGLGTDSSIHFISRYLALRQDLHELPDAIRLTAESTGTGITTSAVTTALAFASAMLTGFPGLAELGLISAIGIVMCVMSTFVFLPALIAMSDLDVDVDRLPIPANLATYRRMVVAWPFAVAVVGIAGMVGIGLRGFQFEDGRATCRIEYDANLMSLQNPNAESVMIANDLFGRTGESLLYAVAIADSIDEALRLRNEFSELPTVGRVSELASRLPNAPTARQKAMIQQLQRRVASLPRSTPSLSAANSNQVGHEIEQLFFVLRQSPNRQARSAAILLDRFLDDLTGMPRSQASAILDSYQHLVARSLISEFGEIAQASTLTPVTLRDLPDGLKARYLRADQHGQRWLIRVYPKEQLWQSEALQAFVQDVRSVDPGITGVPIQNYESSTQLGHSYKTVALYAVAIIAVILLFEFLRPGQKLLTILPPVAIATFIGYTMFKRTGEVNAHLTVMIGLGLLLFIAAVLDYRNLRDTIIAMLPAAGGGAVLLGCMAAMNVPLNPVNMIVLPLLLGIGVDNGIHLVHDYRRQVANRSDYVPSADTINGVLLTSLTSIIGFGSLMISAHQGLFSLGFCLAIGITGCLATSLIPLPAILAIVAKHQPPAMSPVRAAKSPAAMEKKSPSPRNSRQEKQLRKAA
jgi:uncharacterized protein